MVNIYQKEKFNLKKYIDQGLIYDISLDFENKAKNSVLTIN